MDFGRVTRNNSTASSSLPGGYFDFNAEKFHTSCGAGLRIVMNENFVIAVDYGRALNTQDGESGMYIGLNYLF